MDWGLLYKKHIEKCKNQILLKEEYYEKHHIIPRYQGGDNSDSNIVKVTLNQHIIAHYILWRMYNNIEDKIAYKMMQGQTTEGRILKQELAIKKSLEHGRDYVTQIFQDKNKVKNIINKRKQTRYLNYEGKYYPQEVLDKFSKFTPLRNLPQESRNKAKKTRAKTIAKMTPEERSQKFGNHKENHPFWGKERKEEKAANWGNSKGEYTVLTPQGDELYFKSLKGIMNYGFSEKTVKNWRNNGVISKPKKGGRPSKWVGYEIKYKKNKNYGQ